MFTRITVLLLQMKFKRITIACGNSIRWKFVLLGRKLFICTSSNKEIIELKLNINIWFPFISKIYVFYSWICQLKIIILIIPNIRKSIYFLVNVHIYLFFCESVYKWNMWILLQIQIQGMWWSIQCTAGTCTKGIRDNSNAKMVMDNIQYCISSLHLRHTVVMQHLNFTTKLVYKLNMK